ncbi:MAG TPA: MFS transporter [Actinophytocola sp.]|uniref:MFS transporter n=1 Tax=Actinophytocola sp. TaxID=1872138 RepID=UPI002DB79500|nr:MFS transporter [Actinophytocola sp.]HEU5473367.1 MFS transporter [Actinophytocola sp.]
MASKAPPAASCGLRGSGVRTTTTPSSLREFRLLWIGGLLTTMAAQISVLALPLLVLRQTGSTAAAGVIGTVSMGALLVGTLPGGALADAVERRRLLRLCDFGGLLVVSALAVAVLNGTAPLILVLLVAGTGAVINGLYAPAALGLLRAVMSEDQLGLASARILARSAVARLAGPLVGGALFAAHPAAPFVAQAVLLLNSTACLGFIRTRSAPGHRSGSKFSRRHIAAGFVFLWRQPYLRTVLLVFGLGMNSSFSALMFTALAVVSDNGQSGLGGGLVVSVAAAGSLAGTLLAPCLRPDKRFGSLIVGTCWTCAVAAGVLTILHPPVMLGLLAGVCMAMASLASIGFLTALLRATPEEMVGRVQSAASFVSSLVQPLGPLLAGALLAASGVTTTLGLLGFAFAVCAVVVTSAPASRQSRSSS